MPGRVSRINTAPAVFLLRSFCSIDRNDVAHSRSNLTWGEFFEVQKLLGCHSKQRNYRYFGSREYSRWRISSMIVPPYTIGRCWLAAVILCKSIRGVSQMNKRGHSRVLWSKLVRVNYPSFLVNSAERACVCPMVLVSARLMAIADVFDALISLRVYKAPIPVGEALRIIAAERGRQFDPDVTDVFLANIRASHLLPQRIKMSPDPLQGRAALQ